MMQVKHDSSVTWPFPSAKAPDQKPVVFFIGQAKFIDWAYKKDVQVAMVYALNHPKLGEGQVRTSQVMEIYDDGSFETMNTMYIPMKAKQ
jgi:hypothetical protein